MRDLRNEGGGYFVINYGVDNGGKETLYISSTNLSGLLEIPIKHLNSTFKFNTKIQYSNSAFNIQHSILKFNNQIQYSEFNIQYSNSILKFIIHIQYSELSIQYSKCNIQYSIFNIKLIYVKLIPTNIKPSTSTIDV